MLDPAEVTKAHRLLDRARLIAEAPAAQIKIGRGRAHPSSTMPSGAFTSTISTLEACGARINQAIAHDSNRELAAANVWCTEELQTLAHGSVVVAETPREFSARLCSQYEGVQAPQVARAERTYVRRVRDARVADGRDARFGHKLKPAA